MLIFIGLTWLAWVGLCLLLGVELYYRRTDKKVRAARKERKANAIRSKQDQHSPDQH